MATPSPVPRTLKARPAIAMRASFVSQENTRELLGIDARRFLERVVPLCRPSVTALGKLRLVPIDVAEEAIRRLASAEVETSTDGDDPQPETAAAVLSALGKEPGR